ncbi:hypothetical protein HQ35_03870 [Porphyromonas cangingivalis]|uniref:Uncharacterized protein n=1 Tax=Porphyromonas cangingivalis TaxID=36874 RepID=A0A0A2ERY6_PORCN|nr:hypothetical protein HQ35_03870 [Porphyromonas cangingivalis]
MPVVLSYDVIWLKGGAESGIEMGHETLRHLQDQSLEGVFKIKVGFDHKTLKIGKKTLTLL